MEGQEEAIAYNLLVEFNESWFAVIVEYEYRFNHGIVECVCGEGEEGVLLPAFTKWPSFLCLTLRQFYERIGQPAPLGFPLSTTRECLQPLQQSPSKNKSELKV